MNDKNSYDMMYYDTTYRTQSYPSEYSNEFGMNIPTQPPSGHEGGAYFNPTGNTYPQGNQPGPLFPGSNQAQQLLNNPMVADMAMQYGSGLVGQGTQFVQQNLQRYIPTSRMKFYFAVDNMYVAKKIFKLVFPYSHKEWSCQYSQDNQPVPPRYDHNAPDLYIPCMALLTYVLTSALVLGVQNRFTPEQLGIQMSSALGWVVAEILLLMLSLYLLTVDTSIRYLDLMAYSGYKFVGVVGILILGLLFKTLGYYCGLIWFSLSLGFFLIRTLKVQLLPQTGSHIQGGYMPGPAPVDQGNKRRIYLLVCIACIQPFIMWILSRRIVFPPAAK